MKYWKYKLLEDRQFEIGAVVGHINDGKIYEGSRLAGVVKDGCLIIFKGYEWDGCTPKFTLFSLVVGVPDFKETYSASLLHDFLIEFKSQHNLNRIQIDTLFEQQLIKHKFKYTNIYATAVHTYRIISRK